MESLNLSANQLSIIEPELLADAVNSLRDVTLVDTGLSVNQVWKYFFDFNKLFLLGVADPEEVPENHLPHQLFVLVIGQFSVVMSLRMTKPYLQTIEWMKWATDEEQENSYFLTSQCITCSAAEKVRI